MKSLVLGCGPAGLMAAHAIVLKVGQPPIIASKMKRKSELVGAQFLHHPIPGLATGAGTEGVLIKYQLWGDAEDYNAKVYGDTWPGAYSPEVIPEEQMAWDIRLAYNELWSLYSEWVWEHNLKNIGPEGVDALIRRFDIVVSTVPKPLLCYKGHTFNAQHSKAISDNPERGIAAPVMMVPNTIIYNGEPEPSWYRAANVFGHRSVEYPESVSPPLAGLTDIIEPLSNNCDCWPEILHVGSYGLWERGVLAHTAFEKTWGAL